MRPLRANDDAVSDHRVTTDPSDLVEVFDVGGRSSAPLPGGVHPSPDRIEQGQQRAPRVTLDRWPWWRNHDLVSRGLTMLGLAGLLVAAMAGYGALRAHPGTQYFVNEKLAPVPAVTVDALGCPRGAICAQVATPAALDASVLRIVPTGRLTYAVQTVDVASKRVYRREIDVAAPQTAMRFVSQCVPGSGAVPAQPMTLASGGATVTSPTSTSPTPTSPTPTNPTPTNPTSASRYQFTEVVPGARGCSLLAQGNTTLRGDELGGWSLDDLLTAVVDQPNLMVSP